MAQSAHPIRIRIIFRESKSSAQDAKQAFWSPLRRTERFSDVPIPQLEAMLCRQFGARLRTALVHHLAESFRLVASDLFPDSVRDFQELFRQYMPPFPEREWYGYQFAEALTRLLEYRQQILRENKTVRDAQERLAATAGVVFATRIAGYSSLDLELVTASFPQLAHVFEGSFEMFSIFFDAFVPVAFAEVFTEDFANQCDFRVTIPTSAQAAFEAAADLAVHPATAPSPAPTAPALDSSPQSTARARAEWVWRLANGSLVIPVVIAIVVMFYGLRLISDIRHTQYDALQPILQHQLELLKEDRLRMSTPAPAKSGHPTIPESPTQK